MAKSKPIEIKRKDGTLVCSINPSTLDGRYFVHPTSDQHKKYVQEIELRGFDKLPTGFFREGKGLTGSGFYLLAQLRGKYGNGFRLYVSATDASRVRMNKKNAHVRLKHDELKQLNAVVQGIRTQRKQEINGQVLRFLAQVCPADFQIAQSAASDYAPDSLAKLLRAPGVLKSLSDNDKRAVIEAYPKALGDLQFSLQSGPQIDVVANGINATRVVYLKKVIGEFEKALKHNRTEHKWQAFLRTHILLILSTYASVIEKQSVAIAGKYPDFMLIDSYVYLDIYEIKKPQTSILKLDDSRHNYYWDVEACKAIAQVENYIDNINVNALAIAAAVKKQDGREITVVRPRGYIVAGLRSQLTNTEMREDFRILNDSLKNIDVIFYDDLLNNLKALVARLSGKKQK